MRFVGVLSCIVIIALSLGACSGAKGGELDTEVLESAGFTVVDPPREIPDIEFFTLDGEKKDLSEFRGETVMLNFWATWCPPCRAEMPSMGRLADELAGNDFVMIPINILEPAELVVRFVEEYDIDFPVYLDPDASAAVVMGIGPIPASILIDREGRVVAVIEGALEWDDPPLMKTMGDWSR